MEWLERQKGSLWRREISLPLSKAWENTGPKKKVFLDSNKVSCTIPGKLMKIYETNHVQKRLVLSNLKEAYELFKNK